MTLSASTIYGLLRSGVDVHGGGRPSAWPFVPAAQGPPRLWGQGRPAGPSPQAMRSSLEAGGAAPYAARPPLGLALCACRPGAAEALGSRPARRAVAAGDAQQP